MVYMLVWESILTNFKMKLKICKERFIDIWNKLNKNKNYKKNKNVKKAKKFKTDKKVKNSMKLMNL